MDLGIKSEDCELIDAVIFAKSCCHWCSYIPCNGYTCVTESIDLLVVYFIGIMNETLGLCFALGQSFLCIECSFVCCR